jgi:tRNA-2-methylthio-N6-dimethylallyladenosine synthase
MNYSDSARIKAILLNCGFHHVDTIEQADIIIFDTCSVRQKSEDKIFGKLKEIPANKKIWLTGCMITHNLKHALINKQQGKTTSQQLRLGNFVWAVQSREPIVIWWDKDDLEHKKKFDQESDFLFVNHAFDPLFHKMQMESPNVELFFRIDDTGFLPYLLVQLGYEVSPDATVTNEYTGIVPTGTNQLMQEQSLTAYVPISTGCSQFCAYCIVPYSRGLEKNRPVDDIISEVRHHLNQGITEIVLLGQIVNKHPDFVSICRQILALPWLHWLRYTSPYPTYFPAELLQLHEQEYKLCPHIHMPLQSGSDAILKKMFRWYTVDQYKGFVDHIRALKRPISLTTDIIIWFCDETQEDFKWSMDMIRYAQFDMIYMGIYSPRPGTIAARKYQDNIPTNIKKQRRSEMNELLTTTSLSNNQSEVWLHKQIMIKQITDTFVQGYADNMKNIIIEMNTQDLDRTIYQVWHYCDVLITEAQALKLQAQILPVSQRQSAVPSYIISKEAQRNT